ncbi:MAG TPA: hypothetical protein VIV11_30865 [Kofleriaceae bacterium]
MRSVLALVVVGLVGCIPAPVYRVQRTARVPHPAAPLRTGEPLAGPVELSVGASSVGDVTKPELVDEDASLEVAREQMRGELRVRVGRRGEITGIFESAMGKMVALDSSQAPVEQGLPTGIGFATRYSFDLGAPGLSFGLGGEVMSWRIPYVEYRTCIEYCEENGAAYMQENHGFESVETFGLSLVPTYRTGNVAVFAGAYARRHPTIKRKGTELYEYDSDYDVDGGNYNWMLNAGVEYRMPVVSVLAHVQQNLTRDPVQYGPSFGLAIAFRVPEPNRRPMIIEVPVPPPPMPVGPPGNPEHPDYDSNLPDDPW